MIAAMLKYYFILAALFTINCTTPKNVSLYDRYNENDFLFWSESRKLTLSDFEGKPEVSKDKFSSQIYVYNPASIEKANLLSTPEITAFCVFDKKKSWVNKELANDYWLLYNQVFFDIYEIYTRKLKERFTLTDFGSEDYKEKFQKISEENNKALKQRIDQYQKQTNFGDDFDAVIKWNKNIKAELKLLDTFKDEPIPE